MHTRRTALTVLLIASMFAISVRAASAASLTAYPSGAQTYSVGQLFSVNIFASTAGSESLNAVSGTISYPKALLQLVSIDKAGSIINFWLSEPSYSNSTGQAQFEGGVYNPGFSGSQGKVMTLLFKAKAVGAASIGFSNASILANDGQGSNIIASTNPASVKIVAATEEAAPDALEQRPAISIRSATHPDQSAWYSSGQVDLAWDLPSGVTAIRTGLDHEKQALPTTLETKVISETTVTLEDGTWYFHLQTKDAKGWGIVSNYKINIDTSAVNPPMFDRFPSMLVEGDVLLVSGSAPKNSVINMKLRDDEGKTVEQSAKAGDDGRFQAVWGAELVKGDYTLSAEAVNNRGLKSSRSQDIVITVRPDAIERVAKPLIGYATLFALIAGIVVLCGLWAWYLVQRARHFRRRVRGDIKRAGQLIHVEFKKLLDQARGRRKLTEEEERILSIIRKDIQQTEAEVEDKIRDIGR